VHSVRKPSFKLILFCKVCVCLFRSGQDPSPDIRFYLKALFFGVLRGVEVDIGVLWSFPFASSLRPPLFGVSGNGRRESIDIDLLGGSASSAGICLFNKRHADFLLSLNQLFVFMFRHAETLALCLIGAQNNIGLTILPTLNH